MGPGQVETRRKAGALQGIFDGLLSLSHPAADEKCPSLVPCGFDCALRPGDDLAESFRVQPYVIVPFRWRPVVNRHSIGGQQSPVRRQGEMRRYGTNFAGQPRWHGEKNFLVALWNNGAYHRCGDPGRGSKTGRHEDRRPLGFTLRYFQSSPYLMRGLFHRLRRAVLVRLEPFS